jgi:hypothetical protein
VGDESADGDEHPATTAMAKMAANQSILIPSSVPLLVFVGRQAVIDLHTP